MEKIEYTEYALTGNVAALGGNLWNQHVRESLLASDGKDELGCAARAFFDKILPELHNFVEQKIAHDLKAVKLQVDAYRKMEADIAKEMGCSMSNWGENSDWCGVHQREPMECQGLQVLRMNRLIDDAKKLLAKVEEQGLYHSCVAEGFYGDKCNECAANTEQEILKFLKPTIEVLPTEKRNDEGGNPWAPNKDYPGKPVTKCECGLFSPNVCKIHGEQ